MNIKRTGEIVIGTITAVIISGLIALLCTGALIVIFGLFFWGLDTVFDFVNPPSRFEYDVLSLLRSIFFWLEDARLITFFILWAIALLVTFKGNWVNKKLTWVKERMQRQPK